MEKIVYILGAGFSAPLGLPVMSNFIEKARDQYFVNPVNYGDFKKVEEEIDQIHKAASHYETNVFNIEDILSILELRARLDDTGDGAARLDRFVNYLKAVIKFYTPTNKLPQNPKTIQSEVTWNAYFRFVGALLNFKYQSNISSGIPGHKHLLERFLDFDPDYQYSVITFNYDRILESVEEHLKHFLSSRRFHRSVEISDIRNQIYFAKLHGSIDGEIIPPTWNKGLNDKIESDWKVAYKVLSEANQIRILGYSLPLTDTYFRYLLRATIINTPNLRQIDVICKDDNGSVRSSYDKFIKFPNYRFLSAKIEDYLEKNTELTVPSKYNCFDLEQGHKTFFNTNYVAR